MKSEIERRRHRRAVNMLGRLVFTTLVCKPVKKPPNECVGLVKLNVAAPSGKPSQFWLGPPMLK
jgi:hypothetical protein